MDPAEVEIPEQYRVTPKYILLDPDSRDINASISIKTNAIRLIRWCRATNHYFKTREEVNTAVTRELGQEKGKDLLSSVDIEIVWQSHMVRPIKYLIDTLLLVGYALPHNCQNLDEIFSRKFEDCPELVEGCAKYSKISPSPLNKYLEEAVIADAMWIVHFNDYLRNTPLDEDFLNTQLDNYWRFQYLAREGHYNTTSDMAIAKRLGFKDAVVPENCELPPRKNYLCPPISMDLLWHTHQLHPTEYHSDCKKHHKYILDHEPWPAHHTDPLQYQQDVNLTSSYWSRSFSEIPTFQGS